MNIFLRLFKLVYQSDGVSSVEYYVDTIHRVGYCRFYYDCNRWIVFKDNFYNDQCVLCLFSICIQNNNESSSLRIYFRIVGINTKYITTIVQYNKSNMLIVINIIYHIHKYLYTYRYIYYIFYIILNIILFMCLMCLMYPFFVRWLFLRNYSNNESVILG